MHFRGFIVAIAVALIGVGHPAKAATDLYFDETAFQSALGSFTLVDLDASPLNGFTVPYNVQDPGPAAAFAALGISSFGANHEVVGGQAIQMTKPGKDRLFANGSGFGVGDMLINFATPVNGIGAFPNLHPTFGADGGEIIAYDIGGMEIGRVAFGQSPATPGGFSGLISGQLIASAEITCTFNADFRCGVYDIQFGNLAPIPLPAAAWMFLTALGGLGLFGWRRRRVAA